MADRDAVVGQVGPDLRLGQAQPGGQRPDPALLVDIALLEGRPGERRAASAAADFRGFGGTGRPARAARRFTCTSVIPSRRAISAVDNPSSTRVRSFATLALRLWGAGSNLSSARTRSASPTDRPVAAA